MSKKYFFLLMAAYLMAACSSGKEETVQQESVQQLTDADFISYRPMVTNGTTRSVPTTSANFREFFVKVTAGSPAPSPGAFSAFNQTVTSPDGTTWFAYDENGARRMWPEDGTLVFEAKAPLTLNDNFEVAQYPKDQVDAMLAYETGSKAVNSATGVPLYFRHILSQVTIRACNLNTNDYEVKVLGAKLVNVKSKGTLTHPTASTGSGFSWDSYNPWGDTPNTLASYMNKAGGVATATSTASEAITLDGSSVDITFGQGPMFIIPQQLTAADLSDVGTSGSYIAVLLRIATKTTIAAANGNPEFPIGTVLYPRQKDDTTSPNYTTAQFGFVAVPINTQFKPGFKYTFNLNFFGPNGGGCGLVDPNPVNPDLATDPDVDTHPGKAEPVGGPLPDLNPGEEIVKAPHPIYFTVTVDDWLDTAAGDMNL